MEGSETLSKGHLVEEILSKILAEPLLVDFVHLRPLIEGSKNNRELCDILIEDSPLAIPIQLKVQGTEGRNDLNAQRWARKQLPKASKQTEGELSWLSKSVIRVNNPFRGDIRYSQGSLIGVHGLVVIDYTGPPFSIEDGLPRRYKNTVPIQYLTYNDFMFLCQNLMTLPDLKNYLDERGKIPAWATPELNAECDVYAYFHMHGGKFTNVVNRSDFSGEWRRLTVNHAEDLRKKRQADYRSGFYSEMLRSLHEIDPHAEEYVNMRIKLATTTNITECMRILNRVPRLLRREISDRFYDKARKADKSTTGVNYFLTVSEDQKAIFVFLASRLSREKRFDKLFVLTDCAINLFSVEIAIGIATENFSARQNTFDLIATNKESSNMTIKEKENCKKLFGNQVHKVVHDFLK